MPADAEKNRFVPSPRVGQVQLGAHDRQDKRAFSRFCGRYRRETRSVQYELG